MTPPSQNARASLVRATQATILLVEDDHDVRVSLRSVLEEAGYSVLTVTNGKSALEILEMTTPQPCLIVLDLALPVMDGWEFVERVRFVPESAAIPIVVLSGSRERQPPPGIAAFVHKPVGREALLKLVAQHCKRETKPSVTESGELTPLVPDADEAAQATWRTAQPRAGETVRWESSDGRWIAISAGADRALGTLRVTDSSGRATVVDSYEHALALAQHWQR